MISKFSGIPHASGTNLEVPFACLSSDINRYVLDNGMVILTKEVYPSKVVFLSLWARVGSASEIDEESGISHFIEHMLFKNTKKRKVGQIAQEIHGLGGYLNAFTSFDCTAFWMVLPGKSFPKALEIQYDAIFNPLFDPKEVNKEKNVILEELKMYKDSPSDYLNEKLMRTAMSKHRYGRPIIGFKETLEAMTPEILQQYYLRYYRPNNCFLVAVGDIDSLEIVHKCERIFRKLKEGNIDRNPSPKEPPQKKIREVEIEGKITTGHFQMAFHIPSIFNKDIYPLSLLSSIIGTGKSSRLYRELREKKKLVNHISVYPMAKKDPGLMFIDMELPPGNINKAKEAVFSVLANLRENGITQQELQRAKNIAESRYVYGQETVESIGRKIGYAENVGDYMLNEKFIQRQFGLSAEEIQKAVNNYIIPTNCTIGTYKPSQD